MSTQRASTEPAGSEQDQDPFQSGLDKALNIVPGFNHTGPVGSEKLPLRPENGSSPLRTRLGDKGQLTPSGKTSAVSSSPGSHP